MTPKDQKISKTVELLLMLYRSKQQSAVAMSFEEKATLKVNKQIIFDAGLTIPQFISGF